MKSCDDILLDALYLYQATELEADIYLDHRDALGNADRAFLHSSAVQDASSSTPVADVPILITVSEIISSQKTNDFSQILFAMM